MKQIMIFPQDSEKTKVKRNNHKSLREVNHVNIYSRRKPHKPVLRLLGKMSLNFARRSVNVEGIMTKKEYEIFNIDLQLFGNEPDEYDLELDDDDDDSFDNDDDEYDTQEDNEDGETELEDKSEDEEDASYDTDDTHDEKIKKPKDKITAALIKQKQINRDLKSKLELLEKQEKEDEIKNRKKALIEKLVEKGYDEDEAMLEAEKQLDNEAVKNTVKKLEFLTENADVLAKYPQARKNIERLIKLQKSTGWSIDKICRVEYAAADNPFDKKVKSDQENRLKNKKRVSTTPAGGQTPIQSIKLDPEDERAYKFYAKKNPGVSRKQYAEYLVQASKQKIPHDSWD